MSDITRLLSALYSFDASCSREEWVRIGMSIKAAGLSFDDFHNWSKDASNYRGENDCKKVWESFDASGGITEATLFSMAILRGWQDPSKTPARLISGNNHHQEKVSQKSCNEAKCMRAFDIWERCIPVQCNHDYILRKQGRPDGLRYYPSSELPLIISGKDVTDYLVVPCWEDERLQTLQFISPNKGGKKLNLSGASFNNGYFTIGALTDMIYVCEGIGQAWAVNKAVGFTAVVCFGAGRMMRIAKVLRTKYPGAHLAIVSDRGKEKQCSEVANAISGQWVEMPQDKPLNYDANDYVVEYGESALCNLLSPPIVEMPLSVIFAHDLHEDFTPPNELVEGVLTAEDGSILYGDSNSGKTFFVIDLACAIARGVDWMGRKTEPGLVVYLAAESPASVRRRLQAYQKHHNVRVMNFAIVQSPIDLFDGETDTDAVIQVVHLLQKQCGQKARLIVGDTLARLSAGANENAGQDMGLVVRHFDRIRNECNAHFMLIHHSGKNAAAGARGWSGVRAAVDTEIEVTDLPSGRCAEITKQRDLGTKGIRIGFRLDTVMLGLTKWKSPATSCVVVPVDAPPKNTSKRLSEIEGAIVEYLRSLDKPIKKSELVRHFKGQYVPSAVYRELKKLVEAGQVTDYMGVISKVLIGAN